VCSLVAPYAATNKRQQEGKTKKTITTKDSQKQEISTIYFKSQQLQLQSCARVHRQLCLAINYTEIKDTVIVKWLK